MTVRIATVDDLDWIVATLAVRRRRVVEHAPVFWRPSPTAGEAHREFLGSLLSGGGALAWRTNTSLLVAMPRADGWLVDDAYVPGDAWTPGDGSDLWDALADARAGDAVRFVCPTYERRRSDFAHTAGLRVAESWWLLELDHAGGTAGLRVTLPGAEAVTVAAPPVYAPPGPVLFLPDPTDAEAALPAATEKAAELGCAAIVVNQQAGDQALTDTLDAAGFRRHCDYFTGAIDHVRRT